MPKQIDELIEEPKTTDETAALIDRLLSRAATLQAKNADQFKSDFLSKLQAAVPMYRKIPESVRTTLYAEELFKTVRADLGMDVRESDSKRAKKGGKRAKRVSDGNLVACLATERSEADVMKYYEMTEARCTQRLNNLKKKSKADFREVGGVKMWKALPAAKK